MTTVRTLVTGATGYIGSRLVTSLLEAARDFARDPINDDIAILAVRRD